MTKSAPHFSGTHFTRTAANRITVVSALQSGHSCGAEMGGDTGPRTVGRGARGGVGRRRAASRGVEGRRGASRVEGANRQTFRPMRGAACAWRGVAGHSAGIPSLVGPRPWRRRAAPRPRNPASTTPPTPRGARPFPLRTVEIDLLPFEEQFGRKSDNDSSPFLSCRFETAM